MKIMKATVIGSICQARKVTEEEAEKFIDSGILMGYTYEELYNHAEEMIKIEKSKIKLLTEADKHHNKLGFSPDGGTTLCQIDWYYSDIMLNSTVLIPQHMANNVNLMAKELLESCDNELKVQDAIDLAKWFMFTRYSKDERIRNMGLADLIVKLLNKNGYNPIMLNAWCDIPHHGIGFGVEANYSYVDNFMGGETKEYNCHYVIPHAYTNMTTLETNTDYVETVNAIVRGVEKRHSIHVTRLLGYAISAVLISYCRDESLAGGYVAKVLRDKLKNKPKPKPELKSPQVTGGVFDKMATATEQLSNNIKTAIEDLVMTIPGEITDEVAGMYGKRLEMVFSHKCEDSDCHLFPDCVGFKKFSEPMTPKEYCQQDVKNTVALQGSIQSRTKPKYYGNIQPVHLIQDQDLNFTRGNAIKYICRAGKKLEAIDKPEYGSEEWNEQMHKAEILDLEKAKEYIDLELKYLRGLAEPVK